MTRLASPVSTLLMSVVLTACGGGKGAPSDSSAAYTMGVRSLVTDSAVAAIAQVVDTASGAFVAFRPDAIREFVKTQERQLEQTALEFELGTLGTLQLRLRPDSQGVREDSSWSFIDRTDSTTQVVLSRADSAFAGVVWKAGATYRIDRVEGEVYFLSRIDPKLFRPEGRPRVPPVTKPPKAGAAADKPAVTTNCLPQLISILVAVPAADATALRGFVQVKANVRAAILATNVAMHNSEVTHRVRLADVIEIDGASSGTLDADLSHLIEPNDGVFDDLLARRDGAKADVVVLWVKSATDACGLGYLLTNAPAQSNLAMFSVVDACAVGNLSFAHELGHNLGLEHDRANAAMVPSFPWAFGYQQPNRSGRDIMAYDCEPAGCPRAPMYSSPTLSWAGLPMGIAATDANHSADAARAVRANGCAVANLRS